jgi:hypothetical protein
MLPRVLFDYAMTSTDLPNFVFDTMLALSHFEEFLDHFIHAERYSTTLRVNATDEIPDLLLRWQSVRTRRNLLIHPTLPERTLDGKVQCRSERLDVR